jgi:hypothetical protein
MKGRMVSGVCQRQAGWRYRILTRSAGVVDGWCNGCWIMCKSRFEFSGVLSSKGREWPRQETGC